MCGRGLPGCPDVEKGLGREPGDFGGVWGI